MINCFKSGSKSDGDTPIWTVVDATLLTTNLRPLMLGAGGMFDIAHILQLTSDCPLIWQCQAT